MKLEDINLRDPFVLNENGTYYMYGTRAEAFGKGVGGFDVYKSHNLTDWSEPKECFCSDRYGMNKDVNWAPEVHKYKGGYYMLATFTQDNGRRGTYALVSDSPDGDFKPHSNGALTPREWECLDGTLYISGDGTPYLVFCHEHTQILDGTVCYIELSLDLRQAVGEPITLFAGSQPYWADEKTPDKQNFVTDGPFMYRTKDGDLLMIWSTFVNHLYTQCVARSKNGEIDGEFEHLPLLIDNDGGHGMLFEADGQLMLTFHTPNKTGEEHPAFVRIEDSGRDIRLFD